VLTAEFIINKVTLKNGLQVIDVVNDEEAIFAFKREK